MQQSYQKEALLAYDQALRLGQKEYRALTSRGVRGTLLTLDEMVEQNRIMGYVKRPTMEISLKQIVGTYTSSRAYSFSAGFYPLHDMGSEFAGKWIALCTAHMEEGLRDPIEVYEYLWNYYVVEGNKRVSVLKFFGSPSIRANITRILPHFTEESEEAKTYQAFMRYDRTGLFKGIRLSSPEKYAQLAELEEGFRKENPDSDNWPDFNALMLRFETALGDKTDGVLMGDALVEYIRIYGFSVDTVLSVMKEQVNALRPQLKTVQSKAEPTLVLESDAAVQQKTLVQWLLNIQKKAKVLFAYEEGRTEDNWIGAHEKGRHSMQEALKDQVESSFVDGLRPDNAYELLTEHAARMDMVVVTSSRLSTPALRYALENPDQLVMVYSRVKQDYRLNTYYGRYYETAFLCGVAAGLTTRGKVAYITPQTEKRFTPDINAFGIGLKTVDPAGRVLLIQKYVRSFDPDSCRIGMETAAQLGCDVVMTPLYRELNLPGLPKDVFSALIRIDEAGRPKEYLAAPKWDFGRYYTEMVKSYLSNSLQQLGAMAEEGNVAGLWWGIGTGVLRFYMADIVHPAAANLVRYLRGSIGLGRFNPFHGPLYDSEDRLRVQPHQDLKPYDILNMDWIADFITVVD